MIPINKINVIQKYLLFFNCDVDVRRPSNKLFGPQDIVWSMTLTLDVCQLSHTSQDSSTCHISPESTRATLQLAFPVSLIHPPNPPGPRLASISSRSCVLLDYKGVWPGLDGFQLAWQGDSVTIQSARSAQ